MDGKEKRKFGIVLVALALLLGMAYHTGYLDNRLSFDGDATQDFQISITSFDEEVVRGGIINAELLIVNKGEPGTMYVECGLYDRETVQGDWVPRQGLETVSVEENCNPSEDFVQTKKVNLDFEESVSVGFEMNVPESYGDDVALFCASFEKCWSLTNKETHQTSFDVKDVSVISDTSRETFVQNNMVGFVNMDREGTDDKIISWVHDNSILFTTILITMLVVGAAIVYKEEY